MHLAAERRDTDARAAGPAGPAGPAGLLHLTRREVRWSRRVPVDTHLADLASHSVLLVHGAERTAVFLAEQREHLTAAFPDGTVEETYDVALLLATTPRTRRLDAARSPGGLFIT